MSSRERSTGPSPPRRDCSGHSTRSLLNTCGLLLPLTLLKIDRPSQDVVYTRGFITASRRPCKGNFQGHTGKGCLGPLWATRSLRHLGCANEESKGEGKTLGIVFLPLRSRLGCASPRYENVLAVLISSPCLKPRCFSKDICSL